jgi:hypothetical protein
MTAHGNNHSGEPASTSLDIAEGRTSPVTEIPSSARERPDATRRPEAAVDAARQLLAETAVAITPDTAQADLLACLTQYRKHLAALVAATTSPVASVWTA